MEKPVKEWMDTQQLRESPDSGKRSFIAGQWPSINNQSKNRVLFIFSKGRLIWKGERKEYAQFRVEWFSTGTLPETLEVGVTKREDSPRPGG